MVFTSVFRMRAVLGVVFPAVLLLGLFAARGNAQQAPWNVVSAGSDILYGVAWSPERQEFVTVGNQGVIYTSSNASTWTAQYSGTTNPLRAVAWGSGKYVAVGSTGVIFTSVDGASWTPRTSSVYGALSGVAWIAPSSTSSGFWVAVGFANTILTSPDGVTWTQRTAGLDGNTGSFYAVTWANPSNTSTGMAVVVGDGAVYTSTDGAAWTKRTAPTAIALNGVTWTGSQIVTVSSGGYVYASTDLNSWSSTILSPTASLSAVAYAPGPGSPGSGRLVSVGGVTSFFKETVHLWSDGDTAWATFRGVTGNLYAIVRANGRFVTVGDKGVVAVSNESVWGSGGGSIPPAPDLLAPTANATNITLSPTLSWGSVSGVSTYQVQLATNSAFNSVLKDSVLADTSLVCTGLALATDHYWRARSVNSIFVGPWASTRVFKTVLQVLAPPVISAPAQNASGVPVNGTITWKANPSAIDYRLQLATDSNFTSPVLDDSTLTVLKRDFGPLSYATVYYVRIRARTINGTTPWSGVNVFTTEAVSVGVPALPVLTTPANFSKGIQISPAFVWSFATGAVTYHLQISTTPDFTAKVIDDSSLSKPGFSGISLSGNTDYYWRVRGRNGYGNGPWSEISLFTTLVTAPEIPVQTAPEAFATEIATPVNLAWGSVKGATAYEVQLSLKPDFSSVVLKDSSVTGLSKSSGLLVGSTAYYWRVRARNSAGAGDWSTTRRFITSAFQEVGIRGTPHNVPTLTVVSGKLGIHLSRQERVVVQLFDLRGQNAQVLLDEVSNAGYREVRIPAGHGDLRILRFRAGTYHETRTLAP